MSASLIASYTIFSFFLFYQQLHIRNFRGANQGFLSFLTAFSFASMLGGAGFLLFYGYKISWFDALVLFGIAFAVKFVWFGIEAKLGLGNLANYISIAGVVGIPVCAYFMWAAFV